VDQFESAQVSYLHGTVPGGMVEHKDVVISLLGASAGLSGFVLVFLGLIAGALSGLPPGSGDDIRRPWRIAAGLVLVAFVAGMACTASGTWWLIRLDDSHLLYVVTVAAFVGQLGMLLISTGATVQRVIFK
jgi:hypothetical protein